jgi:hypothetical protein
MKYVVEMGSGGMIVYTQFRDDWFCYSSNIKPITSTI